MSVNSVQGSEKQKTESKPVKPPSKEAIQAKKVATEHLNKLPKKQ